MVNAYSVVLWFEYKVSFKTYLFCLLSRGSMGREKSDKPLPAGTARPNTFLRGSSKDLLDNQSQEEQRREMLETVKQLTGGVDAERASSDADRNKPRELGERALGNKTELALDTKFRSKIQGLEKQQFKTPAPPPGDPSQNSHGGSQPSSLGTCF